MVLFFHEVLYFLRSSVSWRMAAERTGMGVGWVRSAFEGPSTKLASKKGQSNGKS